LITLGGTESLAIETDFKKRYYRPGFPAKYIQVLLRQRQKGATGCVSFCEENKSMFEQGLSEVTPLMKQAKMAISAAGGTLFELACLGVPTVLQQVAR